MFKNFLFILFLYLSVSAQQNPFLPPVSTTSKIDTVNKSITVKKSPTPIRTALFRNTPFLKKIIQVQKKLSFRLTIFLRKLKSEFSFYYLLILLLLAFLYGIIHSLGPGHAKLIIGSHLVAQNYKTKNAFIAGVIFSATHAGVALLLFLILKIIFQINSGSPEIVSGYLVKVSGIFILLIGLYLLWEIFSDFKNSKKDITAENSNRSLYFLAFIAGLPPCPGALLILIFSNLLGIYIYGILAVFAVSAGMSVTVSTIGAMVILLRSTTLTFIHGTSLKKITLLLRIIGTFIIMLFGVLFIF